MQQIFTEAKEKAAAETDSAIKPLAGRLIQYWSSKENGRQQAVNNTNAAIDKCKKFSIVKSG